MRTGKGSRRRKGRGPAVLGVLCLLAALSLVLARTSRLVRSRPPGTPSNAAREADTARQIEELRVEMERMGRLPHEIAAAMAPARRASPEELPAVLERIRSSLADDPAFRGSF